MRIRKKLLTNLILVLASICLTILLAEVFVRIFYPESRDHVLPQGLYESDSFLGWKLAKLKSGDHHSKYFNVNYSTNSFGFRDKERIIYKTNDKFRMLLYGDSQIFGWGIPVENRFSNLLEKSLLNIEIWNLSVPAYGLDQQILLYQKNGELFNSDAVIFFVSDYTIDRINYNFLYQKNKPRFIIDNFNRLKVIPPEAPGSIKNFINNSIKWMYLPFFLEERISILNGKPGAKVPLRNSTFNIPGDPIKLEEKILLFAKDLTKSRNNLMVILFNSSSNKGKGMQDFCIQNDIIYHDISINEKQDDIVFGKGDGHWNSKANQIIFNNLLPDVKQLMEIR